MTSINWYCSQFFRSCIPWRQLVDILICCALLIKIDWKSIINRNIKRNARRRTSWNICWPTTTGDKKYRSRWGGQDNRINWVPLNLEIRNWEFWDKREFKEDHQEFICYRLFFLENNSLLAYDLNLWSPCSSSHFKSPFPKINDSHHSSRHFSVINTGYLNKSSSSPDNMVQRRWQCRVSVGVTLNWILNEQYFQSR